MRPLFPHTSMSPAEVEAARKPQPMEEFDLIDLGSDYGQLTVFELVGYYLENPPPAAAAGEAAPRKKHFGGVERGCPPMDPGHAEHPRRRRRRSGFRPGAPLRCCCSRCSRSPGKPAGAISATTHPNVIAALESPVFVDTREADTCAGGSVEGALCMAPSQFLHPDGASASFRDINWLAGAFGLEPARTAVVFGGGESDKGLRCGNALPAGSNLAWWSGRAAPRRFSASGHRAPGGFEACCGAVSTPIRCETSTSRWMTTSVRSSAPEPSRGSSIRSRSKKRVGCLVRGGTPRCCTGTTARDPCCCLPAIPAKRSSHLVRLLLRDPTASGQGSSRRPPRPLRRELRCAAVPASDAFRGWPRGWPPSRFSASPSWLARFMEGADDHSVHRRPPRLRRLSARILRCLPEEGRGILHLLHR